MYDDLDFEALMQEPPGGVNHGRVRRVIASAADSPEYQPLTPWRSLDDPTREKFLQDGGWSIDDGGNAHRGVLHPDEYVDHARVRELAAQYLGVSVEEIEDAYNQNGRPTAARARTRAHIDARLLALSRAGGNMTALARVLGWDIQSDGTSRQMRRALERARAAEEVAA